jgi:hypothetical protein
MKPDNTKNKQDLEKKITDYISSVKNKSANSFADKYHPVTEFMSTLSQDERDVFVKAIKEMYKSNPYAASGFIQYGKLHELHEEVEGQLKSDNDLYVICSLGIIRELHLPKYNTLEDLLCRKKCSNYESNIIITMSSLDVDRTMPHLEDFLNRANSSAVIFTLSNIFYDLIKQGNHKQIESIKSKVKLIGNASMYVDESYERANKRLSEY